MTSINSNNTEHSAPLLCSELVKRFGDKTALDDLSLSIPNSGVTAILGANGAGKTTLINCVIDQRYKKLSGGQKRRVQFALSILGQPKIVFLDEPTTGLDISARKTVWGTIRKLSKSGTAVVLTTHYLEEADSLADHTIVMSNGKVIADAPTEQIRASAGGAVIRCSTILDAQTIASVEQAP